MTRQQLNRKLRVRRKIQGRADRPRLAVAMTLQHTYAQLIDDDQGRTMAFASTRSKDLAKTLAHGDNAAAGRAVGQLLARKAVAAGIKQAVFDRGYRRFHGRIKALADAAREGGLKI